MFTSVSAEELLSARTDRRLDHNADVRLDPSRTLDQVTLLTAHNAHASTLISPIPCTFNQYGFLGTLIESGVYGHMIDLEHEDGHWMFVHGPVNFGSFRSRMENEVMPKLRDNPNLILWFDIEFRNTNYKNQLMDDFVAIGLGDVLFNYKDPRWADHNTWPTIQELIDANQRVIMVSDRETMCGQYGRGFVMYRPDVTMENMYGTTNYGSCDERHGFSKPFVDLEDKSWPRLFTMNHFPDCSAAGVESENNKWSSLGKHIFTCMHVLEGIGTLRKPNFIAVDFISDGGDPHEITDVIMNGGIILWEGNGATQDIVCGIPTNRHEFYNFKGDNDGLGCENDEARSASFFSVPKGTRIRVCDSEDCASSDDRSDIYAVGRSVLFFGPVISTFEENYNDALFRQVYDKDNGLDGKVSKAEIWVSEDCPRYITDPILLCSDKTVEAVQCPVSVSTVDFSSSIDQVVYEPPGPYAVGETQVEATMDDSCTFPVHCSAKVNVVDNTAPVAVCRDVTVSLDSFGVGSTNADIVGDGTYDNCDDTPNLSLDKDTFDCGDLVSPVLVTLQATDASGNTAVCTSLVTVEDNQAPSAVCKDVTKDLDGNGEAFITPTDVNNGSHDACGIESITLDRSAFTCSDLGMNTVTLTVTDTSNNKETCDSVVTVRDTIAPIQTLATSESLCLWPPNHNMYCMNDEDFLSATDNCHVVAMVIQKCECNQPVEATGDGSFSPDCIHLEQEKMMCFRAERQGTKQETRVYTVTGTATDQSGNVAGLVRQVLVPRKKDPFMSCIRATDDKRPTGTTGKAAGRGSG